MVSRLFLSIDELNLAPTEVLEALNRLLDDNRELYIPETCETVKPHPDFRLFATQNPSGAYGGRKTLSRAFRNRFVELHVGDIPSGEMVQILEQKCSCPPSHAKLLVSTMESLRHQRSKSGVFLGKDGFVTPRDLLRWEERGASSKQVLAREGYMLLAERLRTDEEKGIVKKEIESCLKVAVDMDSLYYGRIVRVASALSKGSGVTREFVEDCSHQVNATACCSCTALYKTKGTSPPGWW
jgi:midasin